MAISGAMIVGGLVGLILFSATFLAVGLLVGRIADNTLQRGVPPMEDEDAIDFRYYRDDEEGSY